MILIACGSRPYHPPSSSSIGNGIYDSDTFIRAHDMPKRLAVVGAGPMGCEYACVMALLGCSVSLIDAGDMLLPFLNSEVSTLLQQSLIETGIELMMATRVDKVSEGPPFTLSLDNRRELKADAIVVAAGRIGNTDGLALENAGLAADARGLLTVNENFQTAQPHIHAAGDVIGFPALASSSMEQARVAMVHAFDLKYKQQAANLLPFGVYTIPECSMVGETEDTAQRKGIPYVVGRARYRDNARGGIIGDDAGFLKLDLPCRRDAADRRSHDRRAVDRADQHRSPVNPNEWDLPAVHRCLLQLPEPRRIIQIRDLRCHEARAAGPRAGLAHGVSTAANDQV